MEMKHTQLDVNGVSLHVADSGNGPTVLFVHGFPDTWRGWRRQMDMVVSAGYRAVAFDMRGFGQSSKPDDVASYTALQCVGDLVGILDALAVERAVLVGHDFGAAVSWTAAMMRPDRFSAVFCLSVPPLVPTRPSMLEQLRANGQDQFYMFRQMRPDAEAEWADAAVTIPGMYYWSSSQAPADQRWDPMDPARGLTRPSPVGLPDFVDAEDAAAAIADFHVSGFPAPLNYYRAIQPYFDQAGAFVGAKIGQPSFFVVGSDDGMVRMRDVPEAELRRTATDLRGYLRLDGVGHWLQLEATERVNEALLGFLREVIGSSDQRLA